MNNECIERVYKARLRDPDNNCQRFASHDISSINDIPDRRVAAVELDQDVRGVCGDHAEDDDGEDARDHADCVHHSRETENADADLVGEEDEGGLRCLSDQALIASCLHAGVLTLVIPSFLPP
jgi:hypothetical protein